MDENKHLTNIIVGYIIRDKDIIQESVFLKLNIVLEYGNLE